MGRVVRIALVAGEASGDLLASHLIGALKKHLPDAVFYGIGGPKMQAQEFDAWWPMEKLSVMGYWDALKHYREIAGIRRQLKKRLLELKPDVFIGVANFIVDPVNAPASRPFTMSAPRSGPGAAGESRKLPRRCTVCWPCSRWNRRSTPKSRCR